MTAMADSAIAKRAISLIDNTSLADVETEAQIKALIQSSVESDPETAAICIYPKWIKLALEARGGNKFKIATVVNFPRGESPVSDVVVETNKAISDGADEIDVVIDYKLLIKDNVAGSQSITALVSALSQCCKSATRPVCLKTIIEAGELKNEELIQLATITSFEAGSDFIKTSTGKVAVNATPEYARIMLGCMRDLLATKEFKNRVIGFKAAGGVKTFVDAKVYLDIAQEVMSGSDWHVSPATFRFGASSLLQTLRLVAASD